MQVSQLDQSRELSGATVVITGGGGLVGSRVAAQLRAIGARPVLLCRLDAYPPHVYRELFDVDPEHPDTIVTDIRNADVVGRVIAECDYVVHAAALADVAACTRRPMTAIEANIIGTQTVLDAVAASDRVRRVVYVSSASVYGNGHGGACGQPDAVCATRTMRELLEAVHGRMTPTFSEITPLTPLSAYANTKLWGEAQTALTLRAVGTSYTILRYFSVYGAPQVVKRHSHSWVVAWFATRAALGLPLHLNGGGHQVRDFTHVEDIATATVRALIAPRAHKQTLNVGTGKGTTIREVAELVREHFPHVVLMETPMPPGDPEGGYANTRRMRDTLEWQPTVEVAEGVAQYAAWLKETPRAIPDWLREMSQTA